MKVCGWVYKRGHKRLVEHHIAVVFVCMDECSRVYTTDVTSQRDCTSVKNESRRISMIECTDVGARDCIRTSPHDCIWANRVWRSCEWASQVERCWGLKRECNRVFRRFCPRLYLLYKVERLHANVHATYTSISAIMRLYSIVLGSINSSAIYANEHMHT